LSFCYTLFSPVFTKPSFQTFRLLMTGWILSARHRYVTDRIVSSQVGHNIILLDPEVIARRIEPSLK
jgi:hypothetical protein